MGLTAVADGFPRLTRKLGLTSELTMLERAWSHECGALASQARLAAVERSAIVVEVKSSSAFHELTLRRRELVRRLNQHFPEPWIGALTVKMTHYGDGD